MLRTEIYGEVEGMTLIRTWDDEGNYIQQDGTDHLYVEAVDPDFMNRSYTETDIPIETVGETLPDPEEGESLEELGVPEEEPTTDPNEPEEGGTGSTIPLKPSKKY